MKSNIKILIVACSLLIPFTFAHGQDTTGTGKGHKRFGQGLHAATPEQRAQEFLKKWDKDGDGKLDLAELTAAFTAMQEKRQERRAEHQSSKSTTSPTPTPTPAQ